MNEHSGKRELPSQSEDVLASKVHPYGMKKSGTAETSPFDVFVSLHDKEAGAFFCYLSFIFYPKIEIRKEQKQ